MISFSVKIWIWRFVNFFLLNVVRPKNLSTANTSSADVCINEIKNYEIFFKKKIKYIVLLQPTSPFRSVTLFNKTKKIFQKNHRPTYAVSKVSNMKYLYSNKGSLLSSVKVYIFINFLF